MAKVILSRLDRPKAVEKKFKVFLNNKMVGEISNTETKEFAISETIRMIHFKSFGIEGRIATKIEETQSYSFGINTKTGRMEATSDGLEINIHSNLSGGIGMILAIAIVLVFVLIMFIFLVDFLLYN